MNRAEIYRRENQSSPDYTVGSKFYIGHLLDAAKLTKHDLALIKAGAGGSLKHEEPVTLALVDLAEQLEGLPHFPIGKGEALLDNEDKYLVQKGVGASTASPAVPPTAPNAGPPRRRRFLNRKRFREALVAIMEGDDPEETNPEAEEIFAALRNNDAGDDSLDEDEENFENNSGTGAASSGASESGSSTGGKHGNGVGPANDGSAGLLEQARTGASHPGRADRRRGRGEPQGEGPGQGELQGGISEEEGSLAEGTEASSPDGGFGSIPSRQFSADVTFNIMASLQSQMLVFKWKT